MGNAAQTFGERSSNLRENTADIPTNDIIVGLTRILLRRGAVCEWSEAEEVCLGVLLAAEGDVGADLQVLHLPQVVEVPAADRHPYTRESGPVQTRKEGARALGREIDES